MAEPIRLGFVLEGEDAREFWEHVKNPESHERTGGVLQRGD